MDESSWNNYTNTAKCISQNMQKYTWNKIHFSKSSMINNTFKKASVHLKKLLSNKQQGDRYM